MADDVGQKLMQSTPITRSTFRGVPTGILREICIANRIPVKSTGLRPIGSTTKEDCVKAIMSFRQSSRLPQTVSPMQVDDPFVRVQREPEREPLIKINHRNKSAGQSEGAKQPINKGPRRINIRIYRNAKDYDSMYSITVDLEENGDLDLDKVGIEMRDKRTCKIIDPENYKPLHQYKPGSVISGDVARMRTAEGYLRAIFV